MVSRCAILRFTTQRCELRAAAFATLGQVSRNNEFFYLPLNCPPHILLETTGRWIFAALQYLMPISRLAGWARLVMVHSTVDAASSNKRVLQHEMVSNEHLDHVVFSAMFCCLHQSHLATSALLNGSSSGAGEALVHDLSSIYSGSLLLRMHGHHLRLLKYVDAVLLSSAKVHIVSQEQLEQHLPTINANRAWAWEVLRQTFFNGELEAALPHHARAAEALVSLTSGSSWNEDAIVHTCSGCHLCSAGREAFIANLKQAVNTIVFRRRLCVPIRARWTKAGPAIDDMLLGCLFHNVLPRAVALWHLQEPMQPDAAAAAAAVEGGDLPSAAILPAAACFDEFAKPEDEYRKLRGARMNRFGRFMAQRALRHRLLILHISLSPLRQLNRWLLKHRPLQAEAAGAGSGGGAPAPPLMAFISPTTGPVHAALKQYAKLALEGPDSARAWFQRAGCNPALGVAAAQLALSTTLLAASELHYRFDTLVLQRWLEPSAASDHPTRCYPWSRSYIDQYTIVS